jgi:3-oxoacyl-[acyl-carrier-protein] synthase-1
MARLFLMLLIFVLAYLPPREIDDYAPCCNNRNWNRVVGNNISEVTDSLRNGTSGIVAAPEYTELGFRSQVHGTVKMDIAEHVDRKQLRFMGEGAAYAVLAMKQAIADSGLDDSDVSNVRTGLIAGSGGPSTANLLTAFDITREKGPKRIGPYMVPRCMSSTVSACIATFFKIRGINYSISSACSTSAHCITAGADAIRSGSQDIVFAGGGEELHWTLSVLFDAMGAMSSKYNDTPELASRPYDADRDGFVIAGGGGMVVLEDMNRAQARGAKIYAELVGYGANSDGADMVAPSGEGALRCMELALKGFDDNKLTDKVDYINAHGTSTPVGDVKELEAVRNVFEPRGYLPVVNSTKSLTGHSLGATGVQEAIYTIIMMQNNFIAASANIQTPDPAIGDIPVAQNRMDDVSINLALSNSFGFGGTNATLALRKV